MLSEIEKIVKNTPLNLNEDDIFNFLKIKKRWPIKYYNEQPTIEIINQLGNKIFNFFDVSGYLNFYEWKKIYDLGFTSIISNILDLNEDLRNLNKKIKKEIGNDVNANFYVNNDNNFKKKSSFDLHNHNYDVIVKQIYGNSLWKIDDLEQWIYPNDVIIIKKCTNHQVLKTENKRLSLTINIK